MPDAQHQPPGRWFPIEDGDELPESVRRQGAFLPRPLPSKVTLSSQTHRCLAACEQAVGRLDEAAERLPDRLVLVRATQMLEAQRSAGIDNLYAALQEMMIGALPGEEKSKTTAVVSRYWVADDWAFDQVRAGLPISMALLGRVSAMLSGRDSVDAKDVWRQRQSWVGGQAPTDAWFLTAPAGPHLRAAVEQWDVWAQADCDLPLMGKIALGLYQLEVLQPFAYGFSHLARLYIGLELVRSGALRDQILPISSWIDACQAAYWDQLGEVARTGDFGSFAEMFADGVRELCLNQIQLIKRLEELRREQIDTISAKGKGASVYPRFVAGLIGSPVVNHNEIVRRYGVSNKTATNVTRTLEKMGLLQNPDNKRYKKVFVCQAALELLTLTGAQPADHDDDVYPDTQS